MPIRIAITHEMHGPELPESIELIGYEQSIKNLDEMINELS
jgi:nondiscriminating glutamyl-tRNA synthetase